MSRRADQDGPIPARVAAILITVAVIAFGAIMVLAGWAPELSQRNRAGEHPYSTAATGYNGLVRLLQAQGYNVRISRQERAIDERPSGLMILTVSARQSFPDLSAQRLQYPTLIVLPKWEGRIDPLDERKLSDTRFIEASVINDRLGRLYTNAEIARVAEPGPVETDYGQASVAADVRLQLIKSDRLEPVAWTDAGMLVAYDPASSVYFLSDPDILNTFGLARYENAAFAIQMVDYLLDERDGPILLDATRHGFESSSNLLRLMFSAPFIGATLIAAFAALLLGWGAAIRFGPPAREERAIALGKQALADNSAGLVTMARRETRMAAGYAGLIRRRLASALGLTRGIGEHQLTEMFDRLGPASGSNQLFSDMETGLREHTTSREDLVERARSLHNWHKDILRRTLHERG